MVSAPHQVWVRRFESFSSLPISPDRRPKSKSSNHFFNIQNIVSCVCGIFMVERRTFALLRAGYIINGIQRNLHYRKRIFGAKGRKKRHRQLKKGGKKRGASPCI